jgi:C1A family cysteine protease
MPIENNFKKDTRDVRDLKFHHSFNSLYTTAIDLRTLNYINVIDQSDLNACVSNACSNLLKFLLRKQSLRVYQPSRLYLYYFTRLIEDDIQEDSGCSIRDALKSIKKYGDCDELLWPYNIDNFTRKPSDFCIQNGNKHEKLKYMSVIKDLDIMKSVLAHGFPIIFGLTIYSSYKNCTGVVSMPDQNTENKLGTHAQLILGFNDNTEQFIIMNSWKDWGDNGYGYIPYEYILDPEIGVFDMWVIEYWS